MQTKLVQQIQIWFQRRKQRTHVGRNSSVVCPICVALGHRTQVGRKTELWVKSLSPMLIVDLIFLPTSLKTFLSRDFLFYIILRRIVLGQKISLGHNCWGTPMSPWWQVAFVPYHGLWREDAPTRYIDVFPTSWVTTHTHTLSLGAVLEVHE